MRDPDPDFVGRGGGGQQIFLAVKDKLYAGIQGYLGTQSEGDQNQPCSDTT